MALRPTEEENIFGLMLGGNFNLEEVIANPVQLENILKKATGRTDIQIERVRLVSTWRYASSLPVFPPAP